MSGGFSGFFVSEWGGEDLFLLPISSLASMPLFENSPYVRVGIGGVQVLTWERRIDGMQRISVGLLKKPR